MKIPNKHEKKPLPSGLWQKCPECEALIFERELKENLKICPKCGYHFKLSAWERIDLLGEPDSFEELGTSLRACDPLGFSDSKKYKVRLKDSQEKTHLSEAAIVGKTRIDSHPVVMGVLEFDFMGGSMASVVGEKICRGIEIAIQERLPLVTVSSSGGARMQEGILSLMQMAKTSGAVGALSKARLPFISVLANPTTGGVSASFAFLGDITIAEPKALISFAGPRVIEQTIKQELPPNFQRAEFLLEHGMLDLVVERKNLKDTIIRLLSFLSPARK